jgi:hypothetical protein
MDCEPHRTVLPQRTVEPQRTVLPFTNSLEPHRTVLPQVEFEPQRTVLFQRVFEPHRTVLPQRTVLLHSGLVVACHCVTARRRVVVGDRRGGASVLWRHLLASHRRIDVEVSGAGREDVVIDHLKRGVRLIDVLLHLYL